jgi:tape measure domain-containing protein
MPRASVVRLKLDSSGFQKGLRGASVEYDGFARRAQSASGSVAASAARMGASVASATRSAVTNATAFGNASLRAAQQHSAAASQVLAAERAKTQASIQDARAAREGAAAQLTLARAREVDAAMTRAQTTADTQLGRAIAQQIQLQHRYEDQIKQTSRAGEQQRARVESAQKSWEGYKNTLRNWAIGAGIVIGLLSGMARGALALEQRFQGAQRTLSAAAGGPTGAALEMRFIREEADRLGLVLRDTMGTYASWLASVRGTPIAGEQARRIYVSVAEALTVMGRSSEEGQRAFLALSQMASKGTVSMEELRQQLGEAIPGVMQLAADAMGMTTKRFTELVGKGEILASDLLPKLAAKMSEAFGGQVASMVDAFPARLARFQNALDDLRRSFAQGFLSGFLQGLGELQGAMTSGEIEAAARSMGETIGSAFRSIGEVAAFVAQHLTEIKALLLAFAVIKVASTLLGIATALQTLAAAGVLAKASILGINAAFLASPFGLVVLAIAAVAAGFVLLTRAIDDGSPAMNKYDESLLQHRDILNLVKADTVALAEVQLAQSKAAYTSLQQQAGDTYAKLQEERERIRQQIVENQRLASKLPAGVHGVAEAGFQKVDFSDLQGLNNQLKVLESRLGESRARMLDFNANTEALRERAKSAATSTADLSKAQSNLAERLADVLAKAKAGAEAAEGLSAATLSGAAAEREHEVATAKLNAALGVQDLLREALKAKVPIPEGFLAQLLEFVEREVRAGQVTAILGERMDALRDAFEKISGPIGDVREKLLGLSLAAAGESEFFDVSDLRSWGASLADLGFGIEGLKDRIGDLAAARASLQDGSEQALAVDRALTAATAELAASQDVYNRALTATPEIWARVGAARKSAGLSAAADVARAIEGIRTETELILAGGAAYSAYTRKLDLHNQALQIQGQLVQMVGEADDRYMVRRVRAYLDAKKALEELSTVQMAYVRAEELVAPLASAFDQMASHIGSAISEGILTGKIAVKELGEAMKQTMAQAVGDMVSDFLARMLRAFSLWLQEWIAKLMVAKAAERAANLGGTTGSPKINDGQGLAGTAMQGYGYMGGGTAATASGGGAYVTGGTSTAAGAYMGYLFLAAVVLAIAYKGFIEKSTQWAEAGTRGNASGNSAKVAATVRARILQIILEVQQISKALQIPYEKIGDVTLGKRGKLYYVKDAISGSIGRAFDSAEAAMEYARVRALQLADYGDEVSRMVQAAIRGSHAMDTNALAADIQRARELENIGKPEGFSDLDGAVQQYRDRVTWILDIYRNDLTAMAEALSQAGLGLTLSLQAFRDRITGHQQTPQEESAERARMVAMYNATLTLMRAELEAKKLDMMARAADIRAIIAHGGVLIGHAGVVLGVTDVMAKAAGASLSILEAQAAALDAQVAAIEGLLASLPKLIDPNDFDGDGIPNSEDKTPWGKPARTGGGGGRGAARESFQDNLQELRLGAMPEVTAGFARMKLEMKAFAEEGKKAGASAADIAEGSKLIRERWQKEIGEQMKALAGSGTDFTRTLAEGMDFFEQLRKLKPKDTGITRPEIRNAQGAFLARMERELNTAIMGFAGLSDPLGDIGRKADDLRTNIAALAEAAGWSAGKIADALERVAAAEQIQGELAVIGMVEKLFGYLEASGKFEAERLAIAQRKVELEFALLGAQLIIAGVFGQFADIFRAALGEAYATAGRTQESFSSASDSLTSAAEAFADSVRDAVDNLRGFLRDLRTDDTLSALSPQKKKDEAVRIYEETLAKARLKDVAAMNLLPQVAREALSEMMSFYAGGADESGGAAYADFFNRVITETEGLIGMAEGWTSDPVVGAITSMHRRMSEGIYQAADDAAAGRANVDDLMDRLTRGVENAPKPIAVTMTNVKDVLEATLRDSIAPNVGSILDNFVAYAGLMAPEQTTPFQDAPPPLQPSFDRSATNVLPFVPPPVANSEGSKSRSGGGGGETNELAREIGLLRKEVAELRKERHTDAESLGTDVRAVRDHVVRKG